MRLSRTASVAAALLGLTLIGSPSANAYTTERMCSAGGKTLIARVHWKYPDKPRNKIHEWQYVETLIVGGTGGKSNIYLQMTENGRDRLNQEVGNDNVDSDHWYTWQFDNFQTQRKNNENFYVTAVFDTFGSDPRCTVVVDY